MLRQQSKPAEVRLLLPPATSSSRSAIRKLLEALRWPVKGQSTTLAERGSKRRRAVCTDGCLLSCA